MSNVVPLRPRLYEAKLFAANTEFGEFKVAGTLCGNVDFACPSHGTYTLSPDEALALITALVRARDDVLNNSDPLHDPRLIG